MTDSSNEARDAVWLLRNLLAVIHRDDGGHTGAVGIEKSVEDAIGAVSQIRVRVETLDQAVGLLVQARPLVERAYSSDEMGPGALPIRIAEFLREVASLSAGRAEDLVPPPQPATQTTMPVELRAPTVVPPFQISDDSSCADPHVGEEPGPRPAPGCDLYGACNAAGTDECTGCESDQHAQPSEAKCRFMIETGHGRPECGLVPPAPRSRFCPWPSAMASQCADFQARPERAAEAAAPVDMRLRAERAEHERDDLRAFLLWWWNAQVPMVRIHFKTPDAVVRVVCDKRDETLRDIAAELEKPGKVGYRP